MGTILLISILFLFFKALPYVLLIWIAYMWQKHIPHKPLTPEEQAKKEKDWEYLGFFQ